MGVCLEPAIRRSSTTTVKREENDVEVFKLGTVREIIATLSRIPQDSKLTAIAGSNDGRSVLFKFLIETEIVL